MNCGGKVATGGGWIVKKRLWVFYLNFTRYLLMSQWHHQISYYWSTKHNHPKFGSIIRRLDKGAEEAWLLPECSEVLRISHGGLQSAHPGHVHIEAFASSRTDLNQKKKMYSEPKSVESLKPKFETGLDSHLCWGPAAWEEVPIVVAMKRDVENAGVAVKHLLGAVTVVNILAREKIIIQKFSSRFTPRCWIPTEWRRRLTQSTMRILLTLSLCCSCLAAMATELK